MEDRVNLQTRLLLVGGTLLLTILLVIVFRDAVREIVVEPLWDIILIGRLFLGYIPQGLFWGLFLLVALYLAVRSLAGRGRPAPTHRTEAQHSGQVVIWARRVRLLARGDYSRSYFLQHLGKLIVDVLTDRERLGPREIRRRLGVGELDVPPEVRSCVQAELTPRASPQLWGIVARLWRRLRMRSQGAFAFDPDVEEIVQFLELQLEVHHDRRDR